MAEVVGSKDSLRPAAFLGTHDEAIATTAAFVNVIDIDYTEYSKANIVIHNQAAGDLDYEILATPKFGSAAPTGTNDDDKGYVSVATGSIATTAALVETEITALYARVVIRIKHTTLTTTARVWVKANQ